MRRLLLRLLRAALFRLERGPAEPPSPLDAVLTPNHTLRLTEDEAVLFRQVGRNAQNLAKVFGDRQNSETKLKPREAEAVVCVLLNCGNLMTRLANDQFPPADAPKETPQ